MLTASREKDDLLTRRRIFDRVNSADLLDRVFVLLVRSSFPVLVLVQGPGHPPQTVNIQRDPIDLMLQYFLQICHPLHQFLNVYFLRADWPILPIRWNRCTGHCLNLRRRSKTELEFAMPSQLSTPRTRNASITALFQSPAAVAAGLSVMSAQHRLHLRMRCSPPIVTGSPSFDRAVDIHSWSTSD